MRPHPIGEREARALAQAGAIRSVSIEPAPGDGWVVVLRIGMEERPLMSTRKQVRIWKRIDAVVRWLADMGIAEAVVRTR